MNNFITALFTNTRTLKLKSRLYNFVFAAVNHNYDHKQWTLKLRNTQNESKSTNHRSQTLTFWTRLSKVLFPKRSIKMIDGSEKCKRQLVFELQSSRVYEKRSNLYQRKTIFVTKSIRIQKKNNVGKRKTGVLKRMLIIGIWLIYILFWAISNKISQVLKHHELEHRTNYL